MARTGRPKQRLLLESADREQLQRWARRPKTEQRLAVRSRIVLRCADGLDNDEIAAELAVDSKTVSKWRRRFLERGPDGLSEGPRPGVPRTVLDDKVEEILRRTIEETYRCDALVDEVDGLPGWGVRLDVWVKTADEILTNLAPYCERISATGH